MIQFNSANESDPHWSNSEASSARKSITNGKHFLPQTYIYPNVQGKINFNLVCQRKKKTLYYNSWTAHIPYLPSLRLHPKYLWMIIVILIVESSFTSNQNSSQGFWSLQVIESFLQFSKTSLYIVELSIWVMGYIINFFDYAHTVSTRATYKQKHGILVGFHYTLPNIINCVI